MTEQEVRPELREMEEGLNSEGFTLRADETALSLRPGEDIEARRYFEEAQRVLEYAKSRVIASLEDTKAACDDLVVIARLKKALTAKRAEKLDPYLSKADAIRETYKFLMFPILEVEVITKNKMLVYAAELAQRRREQEEINRKRMEAAEAEMKLNGELTESVNLVDVQPEVPKKVSTDMGSTGQRANWKYEVVDLDALPREYMMPDSVLLNATAKKYHDTKAVSGVRFYNEPIIQTRGR